jgi:hypothetical protein
MEIVQQAIESDNKIIERLARSIIHTSFAHKIDWTNLGQEEAR